MAQVDPNIALSIRPVQIPLEESPLNRMRGYAEYENALLKSQEMQRGIQQRNALAKIHADPSVKVGSPEYLNLVQQRAPDLFEAVMTRGQKRAELEEKIEANKFKNFTNTFSSFKTLVPSIQNEYDVVEYTTAAYNNPDLKPYLEAIRPLERAIEVNTQEFYRDPENWRMQAMAANPKELFDMIKERREANKPISVAPGGVLVSPTGEELFRAPSRETESDLARLQRERQDIAAKDPNDPRLTQYDARISKLVNPAEHLSDLARKQDELVKLEEALAQDPNNKKLQQRIKEYKADIRKDTEWKPSVVVTAPTLSKDALDMAADRFLTDGTLPTVSRPNRDAIVDRAAALAKEKGINPDRVDQLANKANTSALTQLTKQETMVGAFEKNFIKNVDIVDRLSKKTDNTGVPLLQKWINEGKRATSGDPNLAGLAVAIKAVQNEYGKIVSGSMGNTAVAVSEIKRMEKLLNDAQTPQDVQAVLNVMREETQNRMAGFKEQKAELTSSMRSATKAPNVSAAPYTDKEKERRYQEWKAQQGKAKP